MMRVNRVDGMSGPHDLSVESGVFVSGVVHGTGGAVSFQQLVVALYLVTVALLVLFLDVVGVFVLHPVFEFILGMGL
jgi:hypothetical protein